MKNTLNFLLIGREKNEKDYLEIEPWLNRVPIRHEKVLCKSPRETIRG